MRIRGFAMADGVSFSDGKLRYTGRRLLNGELEIRLGGSWFSRFTIRQKLLFFILLILTGMDYGWKGFNEFWFLVAFLLIAPFALRLSASQKKYHGAEHMAVNLYEGRKPSVYHPGCGSNLALMLLPGLLLELLPWGFWITLLSELVYMLVILRLLWPAFQHGLRKGDPIAKGWWQLSRRWQSFFVAEPSEDELCLAIQTLNRLIRNDTEQ